MIDRRMMVGLVGSALGAALAGRGASAQTRTGLPRVAIATPVLSMDQLVEAGLTRRPPTPTDQLTGNFQVSWRLFFEELERLGWIEGRTIFVDRWSFLGVTDVAGRAQIIAAMADSAPDVIFVQGEILAPQITAAITDIPVVAFVTDPVELGMLQNLARPEGNVTGTAGRPGGQSAFDARALALLAQIDVSVRRIAWVGPARLLGPEAIAAPGNARAVAALAAIGIEVLIFASDPPSYATADIEAWQIGLVEQVVAADCQGIYFSYLPEFHFAEATPRLDFFSALLIDAGLASLSNSANFVRSQPGTLASLGFENTYLWPIAAQYVDRILRGAAIADLPVHMVDRTIFVLNLRTASALGITVPVSVLIGATEVVE